MMHEGLSTTAMLQFQTPAIQSYYLCVQFASQTIRLDRALIKTARCCSAGPKPGRCLEDPSAVWPLPLVNVIPGAIIVLIAIAYLQEDGLLLAVAAAAAFLSLAGFGWTLWTSGGAVMQWIGHSRKGRS